jgi:hypothetical protein
MASIYPTDLEGHNTVEPFPIPRKVVAELHYYDKVPSYPLASIRSTAPTGKLIYPVQYSSVQVLRSGLQASSFKSSAVP